MLFAANLDKNLLICQFVLSMLSLDVRSAQYLSVQCHVQVAERTFAPDNCFMGIVLPVRDA